MKRILAILTLAAAVLTGVSVHGVMAQPVLAGNGKGVAGAAVEQRTLSLVAFAREFQKATESARPAIQAQLVELARERRLLLTKAVESDPAVVLRVAMPARVRDSLPAAARAEIEEHVDLEGTVQVMTEEKDERCSLHYYLSSNGGRFKLSFTAAPPELLSGAKVRARGVALGADSAEALLVVDPSLSANLLVMRLDGATTTGGTTVIPSNTFGEQRVLVLLVNFPGNQSQPWTIEQARTLVFGVPNDFYRENSSGQTWLTGDVAGWFTIPVDVTAPSASSISYYARQAATNAGINLSAYSRFIYAFPSVGNKIGNQGTVGGSPSETWLEGTLSVAKTVIHELGHNFGLAHSNALECGTQPYAAGGTPVEYGDVLDAMGNTSAGHFTAFQKQRLGWLDYGSSPLLTHVVANGTYGIEPYAATGAGVKALQIPQGTDPVSGKTTYFFVESRQAVGTDSWLTGSFYASALNGLAVHVGTEGDYRSSYLLDMNPQSQTVDWNDPALPAGRSYTDPASGVTITANDVGTGGASVSVSFSQPVCVAANPSLSLTPAQGPWVGAGSAVNFDVTVVNGDSALCSNAVFDLSATLPAGWSGHFSQPSLNLPPGASATAVLTVTSATSAADGFYPVTIAAVHSAVPSRSASLAVTYVVNAASANHPPAAAADAATTAANTAVTIQVLANDSDPDGDPLAVASVTQGANGTVTVNANGSVTYTPKRRFGGSDQFSYNVSDGRGGSASALVSVTVGSTTKGGGKR
ncbi:MAG: Ig-like domain-containing protein [Geobacteraceae bacterium]|nr:Ig-like domain-containing protein [Geobacteraceae bacterium]